MEAETNGGVESATIGILMLDTQFPRVVGDIGNPTTFPFPVRYHRVAKASAERVVRQDARTLLPAFIEGARALEREGVLAITTSCGFLARFQRELTAAVAVPVLTSSLLLVPLVSRMLPPGKAVGILTIDSASLTEAELIGAGVSAGMAVVVAGMETEEEFHRAILEDRPVLDVDRSRAEHVRVAGRLVADHPTVGAIVLECTNMPPYRVDIQRATGLPVLDVVHLVNLVHQTLSHQSPSLRLDGGL
jgi:Asp/Glu/hydantoin racemase